MENKNNQLFGIEFNGKVLVPVDQEARDKANEIEVRLLGNYYTKQVVDNKVDKVPGKGLSENDFTDELLEKLESIEFGATSFDPSELREEIYTKIAETKEEILGQDTIEKMDTIKELSDEILKNIDNINSRASQEDLTELSNAFSSANENITSEISSLNTLTSDLNEYDSKLTERLDAIDEIIAGLDDKYINAEGDLIKGTLTINAATPYLIGVDGKVGMRTYKPGTTDNAGQFSISDSKMDDKNVGHWANIQVLSSDGTKYHGLRVSEEGPQYKSGDDIKQLATEEYVDNKIGEISGSLSELSTLGNETIEAADESFVNVNARIDELSEMDITLSEDLFTYVPIGNAQTADNEVIGSGSAISITNRGKLGSAGDSLKSVFNMIFGTQQDVEPSFGDDVKLSVTTSNTTYGGGEYGTAVTASTASISFTLDNSGTASYGYRVDDTKYINETNFYYPVVKQNDADIKITFASVDDRNKISITEGSLVSEDENIIYCNFSSAKRLSFTATLSSDTVTDRNKTRFGITSAVVKLGAAQKNNSLTVGNTITSFLTFLENDANSASNLHLSHNDVTQSSSEFTISAGSKYTYWAYTPTLGEPESWIKYGNTTSVTDLQLSCGAGDYIWVASTGNYSSFYAWNDASGKYNTDILATTKTGPHTIINSQGVEANGYYFYRTTNEMLQATNTKFKLV